MNKIWETQNEMLKHIPKERNPLVIPNKEFETLFNFYLEYIRQLNKVKHEKYGQQTDYFSSFRLSEDLNVLPVERLIYVRGFLDKSIRIGNLKNKDSAVINEWVEETVTDLIGYALLLNAYIQWKKANNFWSEKALQNTEAMIDYISKTVGEKNTDYSGKNENQEDNAIRNFVIAEKLWFCTTQEGILARLSIKIQRLGQLILNNADSKAIGEEVVDLSVYAIIYLVVRLWQSKQNNNNVSAAANKGENPSK